MIRRRIEQELDDFWTRNAKEALLVSGARQVGKTFIVREFARRRFKHFVEINFVKNPRAKALFADTVSEDEFFTLLTTLTPEPIVPGETLVFFDEVQACPEAVTFIKFLVDDGRCRYVLSGSLLGIELKDVRSAPVGYLREVEMFPLDFREFVEACLAGDLEMCGSKLSYAAPLTEALRIGCVALRFPGEELAAALGVSQDYVRHMATRGSIVRVKCPGMRPRYTYPEFRPAATRRNGEVAGK